MPTDLFGRRSSHAQINGIRRKVTKERWPRSDRLKRTVPIFAQRHIQFQTWCCLCARISITTERGTHKKSGRPNACKSHQRATAAATPTISIILLVNSWVPLKSGRQLVFYPWPTCAFDAISMGNLTYSHNLLDTTVRGEAANKMPPDTVARARAVNLTFGQLNWVNKPQPARRMESFNLFVRSLVSNCN